MACQSSTDELPGQLCSSVILTSGPISLAQTAKNCRTGPGRLDHPLATFFGPDLGEVSEEARRECLPSTDRPAVQVAGVTGFPLRRFADFSYVT
jgi:hypothetical protein